MIYFKYFIGYIFIFTSSVTFSFVVFDPSNFIKNSLTAAQTAEQILLVSSQYEAQLKQFETQLLQLKNLPIEVSQELLLKNRVELEAARDLSFQVESIYGSISEIKRNFTSRLDSARLLNMNWPQYLEFEKNRIDRSQVDAISISSKDLLSVNRLKRDYEFASSIEAKISSTSGIHEAMQILNIQINRIITQNADLLRSLNVSLNGQNSGLNLSENNFKDQLELNRKIIRENLDQQRFSGEVKVFNLLGRGFFQENK
jgi:P-type conjugative transfer protein TrbJ